jgi:hypothetical protein
MLRAWLPQLRKQLLGDKKRIRPMLEELECRQLLSGGPLIPHGGPVIQNVEISALFLGQEWQTTPQLNSEAGSLINFLHFLPQSPYMGLLGQYGVGYGNLTSVNTYLPNPPREITDQSIESALAQGISIGAVPPPNPDRFYIVFAPPGVDVTGVQDGKQITTAGQGQPLGGYHYGFVLGGNEIRYAVIPYETLGNLNPFQAATVVISHELSEGVTDPWGTTWYSSSGQEVGDLAVNDWASYQGYIIQAEWSNYLRAPAIPSGAQPINSGFPSGGGNALDALTTPNNSFNPVSTGWGSGSGFASGTTTTLAVSPSSVQLGQSVTLTATVAAGGSSALDGSVTFKDGSTVLGTSALNNGTATLSTSNFQPGNNSITATYNGNALFTPSASNAVNVTVTRSTPPLLPPPPPSFFQAAETLFIDGIDLVLDRYLNRLDAISGLNASIAANSPYAEPFSPYFVLAGEVAAANALSNSL